MASILLVDDDPDLTKVAARMLSQADHRVESRTSGRAALELLETQSFDLLIVDVVMPEKGGIETLMEVHTHHPSLPTLVMSGKIPLEEDAIKALVAQYGATGILAKPFTSDELLAAIDAAMA